MNLFMMIINITMLLILLLGPFYLLYKVLKKTNTRTSNDHLEARVVMLEKKVKELEEYIEESE